MGGLLEATAQPRAGLDTSGHEVAHLRTIGAERIGNPVLQPIPHRCERERPAWWQFALERPRRGNTVFDAWLPFVRDRRIVDWLRWRGSGSSGVAYRQR